MDWWILHDKSIPGSGFHVFQALGSACEKHSSPISAVL